MLFTGELCKHLPVSDRIAPLMERITAMQMQFRDLYLEHPDTNEGKQLSGFCKKFNRPLMQALQGQQLMDGHSDWRLHLFFLDSSTAYIGIGALRNSNPHPMGIARLKMPRGAPSRSTLKLEEAILNLLTDCERDTYLCNGMTAVDLGASPGGWTWQLAQRGMRVQAVDNGPMDQALMDGGLVKHVRADGFKYRPQKPVDWLVCDMVERPLHISRLISRWLVNGDCAHAVFNLKLPMKQRYAVTRECRQLLEAELRGRGMDFKLRMKQLYHDREEITCLVLRKAAT
jgi:23S rRNA (cytidine2498-2'-O)-methyltransferase